MTISVLTWNLWWRFGPWEQRYPAILETIGRLDPDIAGLQEVWVADGDSSAAQLAKSLGYHVAVEHVLDLDGVGFGNAVLSRWPILSTEVIPLPAGEGVFDEQRFVLFAEIDGPSSRIQVFTTHLNWRYDHGAIRQQQVRALCEAVAAKAPREFPPIVCGDFNAEPDSDEIRMVLGKAAVPSPGLVLFDAWGAAPLDQSDQPGFTWDERNPFAAAEFEHDRRIDYVMTGWRRNDGRGKPESCRVVANEPIDGVWPSDHFGVLAELRT